MKRFLYIAAIAALLAAPADSGGAELAGSASIGVGILDIDNESYKFGEYTGLTKDGAYLLGSANIGRYGGPYYLELAARDIGLDSRDMLLRGGKFGRFDSFISFSQTPRLISNNSRTIFEGAGSSNLTLPAGFVRGANTTAMTNIGDNLKDVKLELKRKKAALGFSERLKSGFGYSLAVSREDKEGIKSIGGTVGTSGGNARGIVLPEPVDYRVDELRAGLDWQKEASYIRFDYLLSKFDNSIESLKWENPYTGTNFPTEARISLPPDNRHQRFSLSGGTALPFYSTRINLLAEYGMMEQDEALQPFAVGSAVSLPRNSAQAEIDTRAFTLNIASRPVPKLGVNMKYRYYSTRNETPREIFRYIKNDTGGQIAENDSVISLPFDHTSKALNLDGSYYLSGATTVRAGYDNEVIERSFREAEKTKEDTIRAGIQSGYFENLSLGLKASYSERKAEGYDQFNHYSVYRHPDYVQDQLDNTPPTAFDNNPFLRKFDQADRDRTRVGVSATYFPSTRMVLSAFYDYSLDDYNNSVLGLQSSKSNRYSADVSMAISDQISVYSFYMKEFIGTVQKSVSFTSKGDGNQSHDLDGNFWKALHDVEIDTVGTGASIGLMENRLVIKADYSYSESRTEINFEKGINLTSPGTQMPDLKTKLHSLALTGTYNIDKNLSLGAGYKYENYRSDDWQTDSVDPASADIANVITLSGPVQDYEAHQALVFLTYRFGG